MKAKANPMKMSQKLHPKTAPKDVFWSQYHFTKRYLYWNTQCTSSTYDTDMFHQSWYVIERIIDHRALSPPLNNNLYYQIMYIPIRKTNLSSIKLKASSILVSRGWLNKTKNIGFQKLACITEMFVSARYYIICWQYGDNNPFIFSF